MNEAPIEFLAELLWWTGLILLAFSLLCVAIDWFCTYLIDAIWPPGPQEIAAREAERLAKRATKEFKKRQRMRSVRFFNF